MPKINTIINYLNKHQIRHEIFAQRVGVSRIAMYYWMSYQREPELFYALKMHHLSGGEIELEELVYTPEKKAELVELKEARNLL